jgi:hypothetical protein
VGPEGDQDMSDRETLPLVWIRRMADAQEECEKFPFPQFSAMLEAFRLGMEYQKELMELEQTRAKAGIGAI